MIENIPLNLNLEKPGSADWRATQNSGVIQYAVNKLSEEAAYHSEVEITAAGETIFADVFTDDEHMNNELKEYFQLNTALRAACEFGDGRVMGPDRPKVVYLTEHGLNIEGETLGEAGLPYEGLFDPDGQDFLAVGRKSIGTFKSMVIGVMSGVIASHRSLLPTHAAIIQAPNGKCAGFSGRGNTGKTTSLLSAFEYLTSKEFRVVTDDWSMIDEVDRRVHPVDFLVSIRPESLAGLADVYSTDWVKKFTDRVLDFERSKSKSNPLGINDVYGETALGASGVLAGIIFTSLTKLFIEEEGRHKAVGFKEIDDATTTGFRLRDDANHAPELTSKFSDRDYKERYKRLVGNISCALVFTREEGLTRRQQAGIMASWIEKALK